MDTTALTHPCETILHNMLDDCRHHQKTFTLFGRQIPCIQLRAWTKIQKKYKTEFLTHTRNTNEKQLYANLGKICKENTLPFLQDRLLPLSVIENYITSHIDSFYDYKRISQPDHCLHHPSSTCNYPIDDCPNCPFHPGTGIVSVTACHIE